MSNACIPYSKTFSSYDNQQPHIRADTFVFPYGVRTLGITDTRNGVSTREVLCKFMYSRICITVYTSSLSKLGK
jgi:hypothetical protein